MASLELPPWDVGWKNALGLSMKTAPSQGGVGGEGCGWEGLHSSPTPGQGWGGGAGRSRSCGRRGRGGQPPAPGKELHRFKATQPNILSGAGGKSPAEHTHTHGSYRSEGVPCWLLTETSCACQKKREQKKQKKPKVIFGVGWKQVAATAHTWLCWRMTRCPPFFVAVETMAVGGVAWVHLLLCHMGNKVSESLTRGSRMTARRPSRATTRTSRPWRARRICRDPSA